MINYSLKRCLEIEQRNDNALKYIQEVKTLMREGKLFDAMDKLKDAEDRIQTNKFHIDGVICNTKHELERSEDMRDKLIGCLVEIGMEADYDWFTDVDLIESYLYHASGGKLYNVMTAIDHAITSKNI